MAEKLENNMMDGDPSVLQNVLVSVESTTEWKIHDILFDGTERYLKPLTFTDHVAKLSRNIDWKNLVGSKASLADPSLFEEPEDETETSTTPAAEKKEQSARDNVGPWETVAKNLHQALVEMNVMLDVLQIAQEGKYMTLDGVDSSGIENQLESKIQTSSLFSFKKKVMMQGQRIFDNIHERLLKVKQSNAQSKDHDFLNELVQLRKAWRLKKLGNVILGDLSYRTYGTKFNPNATFEVRKSSTSEQQSLDVFLPKDLGQSVSLKISVLHRTSPGVQVPNGASVNWSGASDSHRYQPVSQWQAKLAQAQRSLLCRDFFGQLSKEAVALTEVNCVVKGRAILINLPHDDVLKIECVLHQDQSLVKSDPVDNPLEQYAAAQAAASALEAYCTDVDRVTAPVMPRPTSGSMTFGSRRARTAGPDALSVEQLASAEHSQAMDQLLLVRLYRRAAHASLAAKCRRAVLDLHQSRQDPLIYVQWCPESTGVWTMCKVTISAPFYESCNKSFAVVEIHVDSITMTLKEGEMINFGTNISDLIRQINLLADQHLVSAAGVLARHLGWQSLHCSITNVNSEGQLEPTLLVTNNRGTKLVCTKIGPSCPPELSMSGRKENDLDLKGSRYKNCAKQYRHIDYEKMTGKSFLHKFELLLSALD